MEADSCYRPSSSRESWWVGRLTVDPGVSLGRREVWCGLFLLWEGRERERKGERERGGEREKERERVDSAHISTGD